MSSKNTTTTPTSSIDLTEPRLYTNREISWLTFDQKVMETAADKSVPLLERLVSNEFNPFFFQSREQLVTYKALSAKEQALADDFFEHEVFPTLTPQSVDAGHPFPLISNTSINFVIELTGTHPSVAGLTRFARLKCPNNLPRFLYFGRQGTNPTLSTRPEGSRILCLEDLIVARLDRLFPGYE